VCVCECVCVRVCVCVCVWISGWDLLQDLCDYLACCTGVSPETVLRFSDAQISGAQFIQMTCQDLQSTTAALQVDTQEHRDYRLILLHVEAFRGKLCAPVEPLGSASDEKTGVVFAKSARRQLPRFMTATKSRGKPAGKPRPSVHRLAKPPPSEQPKLKRPPPNESPSQAVARQAHAQQRSQERKKEQEANEARIEKERLEVEQEVRAFEDAWTQRDKNLESTRGPREKAFRLKWGAAATEVNYYSPDRYIIAKELEAAIEEDARERATQDMSLKLAAEHAVSVGTTPAPTKRQLARAFSAVYEEVTPSAQGVAPLPSLTFPPTGALRADRDGKGDNGPQNPVNSINLLNPNPDEPPSEKKARTKAKIIIRVKRATNSSHFKPKIHPAPKLSKEEKAIRRLKELFLSQTVFQWSGPSFMEPFMRALFEYWHRWTYRSVHVPLSAVVASVRSVRLHACTISAVHALVRVSRQSPRGQLRREDAV